MRQFAINSTRGPRQVTNVTDIIKLTLAAPPVSL